MDELLSKHSLHTEYHIAVSIVMLFCLFIKRQVGNPGPGLGQARTCGWVKPVLFDKSVKLEIYDLLLYQVGTSPGGVYVPGVSSGQ